MIGPVHHIGIAVKDLTTALDTYRSLGLTTEYVEDLPERGVRVAFLRAGPVYLELVEPLDSQGTVAKFLDHRGEGLHHVAFRTEDIATELVDLERAGFEPVDRVPRAGSHGRLVAFLRPQSAHGVLIELVQEPS